MSEVIFAHRCLRDNICMKRVEPIKKAFGISGVYSNTSACRFRGEKQTSYKLTWRWTCYSPKVDLQPALFKICP
jgi:hypothetical protein